MHRFRRASWLLLLLAACARPVEMLEPLPASIRGASHVAGVEVVLAPIAAAAMARLEEKAREKRREAGLPPVAPGPLAARPPRGDYATLPFASMFELVVTDVTRRRGLTAGRPLRLLVEIDDVETATVRQTLAGVSRDRLAGLVRVLDADSGDRLGQFHVDVVNSHQGLVGLLIRGGGIREELAEEFAIHIARVLAGKRGR
jgi:hypothetical protein